MKKLLNIIFREWTKEIKFCIMHYPRIPQKLEALKKLRKSLKA